jgi:hypothetical protein
LNGPHVASVQFKRPRSGISPRAAREKRRELQQQCLRQGNDEKTPLSAAMTEVGTTFTWSCASQNPPPARSPSTARSVPPPSLIRNQGGLRFSCI